MNVCVFREFKSPSNIINNTHAFLCFVAGMFQRLDKMRKHAFASVCLFGGDNDSTISGVWVWKGQDLAFTQSPDTQVRPPCFLSLTRVEAVHSKDTPNHASAPKSSLGDALNYTQWIVMEWNTRNEE